VSEVRTAKREEQQDAVGTPTAVLHDQGTNLRAGLREFLESKGFYYPKEAVSIIESALNLNGVKAFLVRGPPGVGKTSLGQMLAEWIGADVVYIQCTPGMTEDEVLYKLIPSERTKSGVAVSYGPLAIALAKSRSGRVVLILDEFDKTRPQADSFLLDYIQNGRVSLYLDERETVIHGVPDNLIVFITSNDDRSFSEPLMRRVISIYLDHIPPSTVLSILKSKLGDEHLAQLLTQVYLDTIEAGLRKPATIEELERMGRVIKANPKVPFNELLKSFVVKDPDDWEKFTEYLQSKPPGDPWLRWKGDEKEEFDAGGAYLNAVGTGTSSRAEGEEGERGAEEEKKTSAGMILEYVEKARFRPPADAIQMQSEDVKQEFGAALRDDGFYAYTVAAKTEGLERLTDDPRVIGNFQRVRVPPSNEEYLVSKEPLTLDKALSIVSSREAREIQLEFYAEGEVALPSDEARETLKKLVDMASKVRRATRDSIQFLVSDSWGEGLLLAEVDVLDRIRLFVKLYALVPGGNSTGRDEWRDDVKEILELLTKKAAESRKEHFKKSLADGVAPEVFPAPGDPGVVTEIGTRDYGQLAARLKGLAQTLARAPDYFVSNATLTITYRGFSDYKVWIQAGSGSLESIEIYAPSEDSFNAVKQALEGAGGWSYAGKENEKKKEITITDREAMVRALEVLAAWCEREKERSGKQEEKGNGS